MKNHYDVIIVGAGLSGISAGRFLMQKGLNVKLIDKGKMPGGRLATRRIDYEGDKVVFDYGCRYIELNSYEFSEELVDLVKSDTIRRWNVINENPSLSSLESKNNFKVIGKHSIRDVALKLAEELNIDNNKNVIKLKWSEGFWTLIMADGDKMFSKELILSMPVPQVLELINQSNLPVDSNIIDNLKKVNYQRAITALLTMESQPILNKAGSIKLNSKDIAYITDNNQKGINNHKTAITLEATHDFSLSNWELSDDDIFEKMFRAASKWLSGEVLDYQIHKWKYSTPSQSYSKSFELIDSPGAIYIIGDAFKGNNAESAFLSGREAAKELVEKEVLQGVI